MTPIQWINNLYSKLRDSINTKTGRILIFSCYSVLMMSFGMIIFTIISSQFDSTFKAVGLYVSLTTGPIAVVLLLIDRVLSIEIKDRDLKIKNLDLTSKQIDEKSISNEIANKIVPHLSNKIGLSDSVFEAREEHYKQEKEILAVHVFAILEERIRYLKSKGKNVQIILDSGTTIAPILEIMGRKASNDKEAWPNKVEVITNNIRGLQHLLKYRKNYSKSQSEEQDDRYLQTPFECSVLPGKVLSAYQAIVGNHTFRALAALARGSEGVLGKVKEPFYTMTVTTGNYVLVEDYTRKLMPIARADLHPHFKAGLYCISDEVYVVAPLGKILRNEKQDQNSLSSLLNNFNDDLGYSDNEEIESLKKYKLVNPELLKGHFTSKMVKNQSLESWNKKTILVTTNREKGRALLAPHVENIKRYFLPYNSEINFQEKIKEIPHLSITDFNEIPPWYTNQIEVEIPHENLREHISKYFFTEALP